MPTKDTELDEFLAEADGTSDAAYLASEISKAREISGEVSDVPAKPTSPMLAKYGNVLVLAVAKHANDPTIADPRRTIPTLVKEGEPAPSFMADFRNTAKLLSILAQESPQRTALLKELEIDPATVSRRHLATLSRILLDYIDAHEATETWAWAKFADERRNEIEAQCDGLMTRRLSEVELMLVDWLWDQVFPLGNISLLLGDPDVGKTWLALYLAAVVTTGRDFPDSPNPTAARRSVLWMSAEDSDETTIKPRFVSLGGDPTRFHSGTMVGKRSESKGKGKRAELRMSSLDLSRDIDELDRFLFANPLVSLIVMDPITAFLGGIDSHRNSDVRGLLSPLTKLAMKHNVAVLGINHLTKGDGENAKYRAMGSIAFMALARAAWMVTKCPKEPDRREFTCVKNNLASGGVGSGLAFRLGPDYGGMRWEEGRIETTANEALRVPERAKAPVKTGAKEWLKALLEDGPVSAKDALEKAEAEGISEKILKTARKELGVRAEKQRGVGTGWVWSLPPTP